MCDFCEVFVTLLFDRALREVHEVTVVKCMLLCCLTVPSESARGNCCEVYVTLLCHKCSATLNLCVVWRRL